MNASHILQLLANKHSDDLFVAECKNGPTNSVARGQMRRMDAWVMPRSWRHAKYVGYEIKVARSDFVNDKKWDQYLPLCHEFYFVCPTGLIQPDELPKEAGLLWVSKTGTTLFCKKKAPSRKIDQPLDVLRYVLICRATVVTERKDEREDRVTYWKDWLASKDACLKLGKEVSKRLQAKYAEDVERVNNDNRRLERTNEELARVQQFCQELGIDVNRWTNKGAIAKRVEELRTGLPRSIVNSVEVIRKQLDQITTDIAKCTEMPDGTDV